MFIERYTMTNGINKVFRRAGNAWELFINSCAFDAVSSFDFVAIHTSLAMVVDIESNTVGWKDGTNFINKVFSFWTVGWDRGNQGASTQDNFIAINTFWAIPIGEIPSFALQGSFWLNTDMRRIHKVIFFTIRALLSYQVELRAMIRVVHTLTKCNWEV